MFTIQHWRGSFSFIFNSHFFFVVLEFFIFFIFIFYLLIILWGIQLFSVDIFFSYLCRFLFILVIVVLVFRDEQGKVNRWLANHSLSSTASQGTSNIPFPWFLLLGCNRQAQDEELKDCYNNLWLTTNPSDRKLKTNKKMTTKRLL